MRAHVQAILQNVNKALKECNYDDTLGTILEGIRVNSQVALSGDHHVVPSKLFGNIDIPKGVISDMSNGDDDLWFSVSAHIDVNVFYAEGWQFNMYPVKNGEINTEIDLETGKL